MKNFSLEKKFLFIGDKSRFIFARTMTEIFPPNCEDISLILEHGKTVTQIQNKENFCTVTSFKVPPGIKIYLLTAEDESWQDDFEKFSQIFLFEEFPFEKDSTQQLMDTWKNLPKSRPPLTTVIMELAHRQGSTDLDKLDDAIIEAKKNYEKQGFNVAFFRSPADIINILYRHETLVQKYKKILSLNLEEINDRMYELDSLYEDFIMDCNDAGGCLSLSTLNKICSFESVKSSNRNSFWAAYNDAALKKLFPNNSFAKGNFNDLAKIYRYILTGDFDSKISVSENPQIEQRVLDLMKVLQNSFESFMDGGKFSGISYSYEAYDIINYKKSTSDRNGRFYGINAEYGKQFKIFVEKSAKEILKLALENYIKFFERMIM